MTKIISAVCFIYYNLRTFYHDHVVIDCFPFEQILLLPILISKKISC